MDADRTFAEAQLLSAQLLYGRISRRDFIRRAVAAGISASTIAVILDACGGGSSPTATSAAPQPTATLVPTARPVNAGQPTAAAASSVAAATSPAAAA
ncbi:MAG: hypothetical protein ACYDAR_15825, partial [Thermomicrobiales bacterium]